jgi:hypothetical protein
VFIGDWPVYSAPYAYRNFENKIGPCSLCDAEFCKNIRKILADNTLKILFQNLKQHLVGRDFSIGIATRNGLESPGIKSRWGRYFPHPAPGPNQAIVQSVTGLFPGILG